MVGEVAPRTLIFDVNETLLDLEALTPLFREYLGDAALLKRWFSQVLLYSETVTLTGSFANFLTLGRCALDALAQMQGRELTEEARNEIFQALRSVPPHNDVPAALGRLHDNGFRLVALTNSTQSTVEEQFKVAGLTPLFDQILSVDGPRKFKPHPEVYRWAAKQIDIAPQSARMVAAHPWDLMGAHAVGLHVAFVERTPGSWFPLGPKPSISGPTLAEIADQLIANLNG